MINEVVSVTINSDNSGLKITLLLGEYNRLSAEIRTFAAIGIICICTSVLISATMMVAAFVSNQYILFLISPALSLFFAIIPMVLLSYLVQVGLRLNDIEDSINEIIGDEPTMYWKKVQIV
jgi:ABC-type transport system involved in multi-copper enzyme maturation permease subunit